MGEIFKCFGSILYLYLLLTFTFKPLGGVDDLKKKKKNIAYILYF